MELESIVGFFQELNEEERSDIIKLINRDKHFSLKDASVLANHLKKLALSGAVENISPASQSELSSIVLDLVGINRLNDTRAPLDLNKIELSKLLDDALGYSNKYYNDAIAASMLNHATGDKLLKLNENSLSLVNAYIADKTPHINIVKKIIDEGNGRDFKALTHNKNAPSMDYLAAQQKAAKLKPKDEGVSIDVLNEAQERDKQLNEPLPKAPVGNITNDEAASAKVKVNPIQATNKKNELESSNKFQEVLPPKKEVGKATQKPDESFVYENDELEANTGVITPSASDYRDNYSLDYETVVHARDQIKKQLDKLSAPDVENNNFGRTFREMNLWQKVKDLSLQKIGEPGALKDIMAHNLFHRSLGEYDEDGRLVSVHLHMTGDKIVMPNANSSKEIYNIAALKVLEKGIKEPYIKANFANPEEGKIYISRMVAELMEIGYDINDIDVHPKFKKYFGEMKKHILASQNIISEKPSDVVQDELEKEILTREDINAMVSPITRSMSAGNDGSTHAKPADQLNVDEIISVLEGDRIMHEHYQDNPNEYFLSNQNAHTVKITQDYVLKLIERIGGPSKDDMVNGLGSQQIKKVKALYAEGVSNYLSKYPEHQAKLEEFILKPNAKIEPVIPRDLSKSKPQVDNNSPVPKVDHSSPVPKVDNGRATPQVDNSSTVTQNDNGKTISQVDNNPPITQNDNKVASQVEKSLTVAKSDNVKILPEGDNGKGVLTKEESEAINRLDIVASKIKVGDYTIGSDIFKSLEIASNIETDIPSKSIRFIQKHISSKADDVLDDVWVNKAEYGLLGRSDPAMLSKHIGSDRAAALLVKMAEKSLAPSEKKLDESKENAKKTESAIPNKKENDKNNLANKFSSGPVAKSKSANTTKIDSVELPALDEFSDLHIAQHKENLDDNVSNANVDKSTSESLDKNSDDFDMFNSQVAQLNESNEGQQSDYQSDEVDIHRGEEPGNYGGGPKYNRQ